MAYIKFLINCNSSQVLHYYITSLVADTIKIRLMRFLVLIQEMNKIFGMFMESRILWVSCKVRKAQRASR